MQDEVGEELRRGWVGVLVLEGRIGMDCMNGLYEWFESAPD